MNNSNNLLQSKVFDFMPQEQILSYIQCLIYLYCTSLVDNLLLTVLEAISSGNLVISFKNGGAEEVLKNIGYTFNIGDKKYNKKIKISHINKSCLNQKSQGHLLLKILMRKELVFNIRKYLTNSKNQC